MFNPDLRNVLKNRTSRYSLVSAVAKRAREIAEDMSNKNIVYDEQPVLMALAEFEKGKYAILEPNINK